MITRVARLAGASGCCCSALYAVLAGLGLLITRAATADNPLTEDDLSRMAGRAPHRVPGRRDVGARRRSGCRRSSPSPPSSGSSLLRLVLGRWREPVFLVVTVASQALLVALTAQVVSRDAPDVERLDPVSCLGRATRPRTPRPPRRCSSRSTLLVGLARRHRAIRVPLLVVLVALPILVGYADLYRGTHHLTDVLAGYLAGLGSVAVVSRTVLNHRLWVGQPETRTSAAAATAHPRAPR